MLRRHSPTQSLPPHLVPHTTFGDVDEPHVSDEHDRFAHDTPHHLPHPISSPAGVRESPQVTSVGHALAEGSSVPPRMEWLAQMRRRVQERGASTLIDGLANARASWAWTL